MQLPIAHTEDRKAGRATGLGEGVVRRHYGRSRDRKGRPRVSKRHYGGFGNLKGQLGVRGRGGKAALRRVRRP